ncbi:hypothetical protein V6N13_109626 [Hibiscus sabdariffa]
MRENRLPRNSWQSKPRQKRFYRFLKTRQAFNVARLHFDATWPLYKPLPSLSFSPCFRLLLLLHSLSRNTYFLSISSFSTEMADQSSNSAEGLLARFDNASARERYDRVVAAKNIWEEQGFKFDDGVDFY